MREKILNTNQADPQLAINELQKYHLCEWISSIYHYDFDEKNTPPLDTIEAFQAMLADEISYGKKQVLVTNGVWSSVEKVRAIFRDSCPQKTLDLIKFNEISSLPITKEALVAHLRELIEEKISILSERLKHPQENIPTYPPIKTGVPYFAPGVNFFSSVPQADRSNPLINKLNMTVEAFNEKFKGEFSVTQGTGYTQGFWSVKNNKGELCGVLVNSGAAGEILKENELSEKKHNFIENLLKKSPTPQY